MLPDLDAESAIRWNRFISSLVDRVLGSPCTTDAEWNLVEFCSVMIQMPSGAINATAVAAALSQKWHFFKVPSRSELVQCRGRLTAEFIDVFITGYSAHMPEH